MFVLDSSNTLNCAGMGCAHFCFIVMSDVGFCPQGHSDLKKAVQAIKKDG